VGTLDEIDWPLHTERLMLRRLADTDQDALWDIHSSPDGRQWTGGAFDRDAFNERFFGTCAPDMLVVQFDDQVIGDIMVVIKDGWAQRPVEDQAKNVEAELGWCFDAAHHGKGYATEAVGAALRLCFEDLGVRRVFAEAFLANEPSWRLMERLGMRREAVNVANSLHRDHGWLDGVLYALLADEWRARI